jgi:hypothetical protein
MSDYIPIYVPKAHHLEVLTQLVSLMTEAQVESPTPEPQVAAATAQVESPTPEPQVAAPAQNERVWPDDLWRNVWPIVSDGTRKLLVVLAEHAGQRVAITELEGELGSFRAVQSALSSLTKQMKKYGATAWPFTAVKDAGTGRTVYVMTEAMAIIVIELAQDA